MNDNERNVGAAEEGPPAAATAAPSAASEMPAASNGVLPSNCGCGGGGKKECSCKDNEKAEKKGGCGGGKPALAYALGRIGYDFGSEARRDSFVQAGLRNPYDAGELLAYLDANPWAAPDVTFTLEQDATPIYAVQSAGPYASQVYERLREVLRDQIAGAVETVSLPSYTGGAATLSNGQSVPVLWPNARGMYSWNRGALLAALVENNAPDREQRTAAIGNFLERVSYELRNLGVDPRERALNYAATNAFQVARVYESAIRDSLSLGTIGVERSPICRPQSDCWDVLLTFFDPNQRLTRSRRVYRFTVDVSDVIPVTIGSVRHWDLY
jgi:cyanobactin maturation PatA/PatG family protease